MRTIGVDIRQASHDLQAMGVETGERKLRQYLVTLGAIRKTLFGYEVTGLFKGRGLLVTDSRQHVGTTESGSQLVREYCVVLVTPAGINWLQRRLGPESSMQFFQQQCGGRH